MSFINGVRNFEHLDKFGDRELSHKYKRVVKADKDHFGGEFRQINDSELNSPQRYQTANFCTKINGKKVRFF